MALLFLDRERLGTLISKLDVLRTRWGCEVKAEPFFMSICKSCLHMQFLFPFICAFVKSGLCLILLWVA
jgi:hypothetical protein